MLNISICGEQRGGDLVPTETFDPLPSERNLKRLRFRILTLLQVAFPNNTASRLSVETFN